MRSLVSAAESESGAGPDRVTATGEGEMSGSPDGVFTGERQEVLGQVADELELTENSSQKQRRYMT
jgi:hypothetical protein